MLVSQYEELLFNITSLTGLFSNLNSSSYFISGSYLCHSQCSAFGGLYKKHISPVFRLEVNFRGFFCLWRLECFLFESFFHLCFSRPSAFATALQETDDIGCAFLSVSSTYYLLISIVAQYMSQICCNSASMCRLFCGLCNIAKQVLHLSTWILPESDNSLLYLPYGSQYGSFNTMLW